MKKQLFTALFFAALTGTMQQACGMEVELNKQTKQNETFASITDSIGIYPARKSSSNPDIKSNFTSSQTNIYDESKNSFIPLIPHGSILTDNAETKFYRDQNNNSIVTFTDNTTGKTVNLSNTPPSEFPTVKPLISTTTKEADNLKMQITRLDAEMASLKEAMIASLKDYKKLNECYIATVVTLINKEERNVHFGRV